MPLSLYFTSIYRVTLSGQDQASCALVNGVSGCALNADTLQCCYVYSVFCLLINIALYLLSGWSNERVPNETTIIMINDRKRFVLFLIRNTLDINSAGITPKRAMLRMTYDESSFISKYRYFIKSIFNTIN